MQGETHKKDSINFQKTLMFILSACRRSTSSLLISWDIAKILQTYYFGYFGHWRKLWCISPCKKPDLSLNKILQSYYFLYFGHAWSHQPIPIVSTCRNFWCFFTRKKSAWPSLLPWDITLSSILQSDWLRTFWLVK